MKKSLKIILYVFLFLIVATVGLSVFLTFRLEHILHAELKSQIHKQSNGAYQLDFQEMNVSFLNRKIEFKGIELSPVSDSLNDEFSIQVKLASLECRGISIKALRNGAFHLNHLNLSSAEVIITQRTSVPSDHPFPSDSSEHKAISQDISIKHLDLKNSTITYLTIEGVDTFRSVVTDLNISLTDFNNHQPFAIGNLKVNLAELQVQTDPMYQYSLGPSGFDMHDQTIELNNLKVAPQYNMSAFAYKHPKHADRTAVEVAQIKVKGFDYLNLIARNTLSIDSVFIDKAKFESYKNRKVDSEPSKSVMPYIALHQLPFALDIDYIQLTKSNVDYYESSPTSYVPGHISFDNIAATITDLDTKADSTNKFFQLSGTALLMNTGKVGIKVFFPNQAGVDHFEIYGDVKSMPISKLNVILEPLAKVRIKTGDIDLVKLAIIGNSQKASIDLKLGYTDLQIILMKDKNHALKKMGFVSRVVNNLLVKRNNPAQGSELQSVQAIAIGDPYRGMPNYVWRTVLEGIKITLGLTPEKAVKLAEFGSRVQKLKVAHEAREKRAQERKDKKRQK